MSNLFSRGILTAVFAVFTLGTASMAHADVFFHNVADQPIVFSISCTGHGFDQYTVASGAEEQISCDNHSPAAQVEIRTDDGNVVDAIVWDGRNYDLGYNDDGDATLWSE